MEPDSPSANQPDSPALPTPQPSKPSKLSKLSKQSKLSKLSKQSKQSSEKVLPSAMSPEESRAFDSLMQQADRALKLSAYNTIDMRSLLTLPTASEQVKSVGSID